MSTTAAAGANAGVAAGHTGATWSSGIIGSACSARYQVQAAVHCPAAGTTIGQRRAGEHHGDQDKRRAGTQARSKPYATRLLSLGEARESHEIPPTKPQSIAQRPGEP
ncbi:hypothetical protein WBO78_06825 [Bosea sp. CCNWLW174]|uniref:hypothetical protein n=1 Tax=unclassified Bosea (in: a-proteobacteria) TaxID=2653178 RepID=UPI0030147453